MDTFWLKAVLVLVVIIVCVGAVVVWTSKGIEESQTPETTFEDMVKRDKDVLLAEPNAKDLAAQTTPPAAPPSEPQKTQEPVQQPPEPVIFFFTEVQEIEQIEAERLLAMIPTGRSIGRLPATSYNLMVESCRQIMQKWPGSIYDYQARRALNDLPEQYKDRYGFKPEDLDLTFFTKPRAGTKPYTLEEQPQEDY